MLWKNVPRDEKRMSACCLGPKEGSLNELERGWGGSETAKTERGSFPLLWSGCVNEGIHMTRTEGKIGGVDSTGRGCR